MLLILTALGFGITLVSKVVLAMKWTPVSSLLLPKALLLPSVKAAILTVLWTLEAAALQTASPAHHC